MTDRRQGDRREASKLQKKISISLSNFIYLCIIFLVIITAIVVCKISYNRGFEDGYIEGYSIVNNDYYIEEDNDYSSEE